mgnify:CR=1 FL=1
MQLMKEIQPIMKRKLQINFNSRIKYVLALCALLMLNTSLNYAQTSIVSDDFNRATLSPGGTPSLTYTSVLTGIATSATVVTTAPDYRLQIINGTAAGTAGTRNRFPRQSPMLAWPSPWPMPQALIHRGHPGQTSPWPVTGTDNNWDQTAR